VSETATAEHTHIWVQSRCACGERRCIAWHCEAARLPGVSRCSEHIPKRVKASPPRPPVQPSERMPDTTAPVVTTPRLTIRTYAF
jgi:hypothetical protein